MNKSKKPKITNSGKFKTMILSVIIAIAVWLVAVYVDDPSITVTATSISAKILNEDVLSEKGLVIKNKEKIPTFSVRVNGKRSSLMNYMNKITADFNVDKIDMAGEYVLEGNITLPNSSLTVAKKGNTSITIEVANRAEKTVKLYANQSGSNRNYLVKSTPKQTDVIISGAEDEVERIAYAAVDVNISEMTSDFNSRGEIFFCDADGNKLTDVTSVTSDKRSAEVENKLYLKTTVEVKPELAEELSQSFVLDKEATTISPKEIEVGVLEGTDIASVKVIIDKNLPGEEMYRAQTDVENVYIPYSNAEVAVTAKMSRMAEKKFDVEISAENIADGFKAEFEAKDSIVIKCGENVQAQDISATINLKELGEGEHYVKVQVKGDGIISAEEKFVSVKIVKEG